MKAKINAWGNSPALRIPKLFMEQCNFSISSDVNMEVIGNKLIIELEKEPELTLEALLSTCTAENTKRTADEQDWLDMKSVGKENT